MRKFYQKKILDLLKTLIEANDEINRFLLRKEYSNAIRILADCQDFVISISEYIESIEGDGTNTVYLLEKYCKLLYDASLEIGNKNGFKNLYKLLQKQLLNIENSVRNELKPKKFEVAFFPYKSSMFDSLESIWTAAKNDPECDVYMVPIPYYDRLSNGSFGEMHYEGEQYPDNVQIIDWREYDVETRHPDIIFIHSPYDSGNYVTSIHPDFYSEKLKKFTDLLVYVPYFVCVDDVDEDLCVCAGTLYADIVVVQSKKIRQTYIHAFRKFEKENRCKDRYGKPEEKFVALGSPKFDKVINTIPEDYAIPEEWERLIKMPDGTRKKVMLYNTSISMILQENELYLKKIRYVLDTFRGFNDVVLLWRPHPLNTAVYQSMRPHLFYEYERIISEYRRNGWGIYDDTPDLHRAIAISDAYYGDGGSVAALYQPTGKPAMIQNTNIDIKDENPYELAFENLYDDGEYFWFTSFDSNALFRMDKQIWEAEHMGSFPNEHPDRWRLYASITGCGDDLYFAPLWANKIMRFNRSSKTFDEIPFIFKKTDGSAWDPKETKLYSSVSYNQWIFFTPASYPAFLRYDTVSGRMDSFSDWLEPLERMNKDTDNPFFKYTKEIFVLDSVIYACVRNTNAVVAFDMESCVSMVYEVGSKGNKYVGICFDGCDFWLAPLQDTHIVRWNLEDNTTKEYNLPNGFLSGGVSFWDINYSSGYVWLFPNRANMSLRINIKNDCVEIAEDFQNECAIEEAGAYMPQAYILSKVIGNVIYAHTGRSNRFIIYDCINDHKIEKVVVPDLKSLSVLKAKHSQHIFTKDPLIMQTINDSFYHENDLLTLRCFIDYICLENSGENTELLKNKQREIVMKSNVNMDGSAGNSIYRFCKKLINFNI